MDFYAFDSENRAGGSDGFTERESYSFTTS
jgi:hypothetical protein